MFWAALMILHSALRHGTGRGERPWACSVLGVMVSFLAPGGTCIPQQDAFSSCVRLKPRRCDHHLFRVLKPPSLLDVLKQNGHDRPSRSSDQLWSARIIKKVRPFCTRSTPKALMHLRRASCVKYLIFQMDLWNVRRMGRVVYRP